MDWIEIARVYIAVMAVLLIVLFLRLAVQRVIRYGIGLGVNPHPLASIGIAILIGQNASRQYEAFGEGADVQPATWRLWLVVAGLTVCMFGMILAVDWRDRPWRRRPMRPDESGHL